MDLAGDLIQEAEYRNIPFDVIVSRGVSGADSVAEVIGVKPGVLVIVPNVGRQRQNRKETSSDVANEPYVVKTVATYECARDYPQSGKGACLYRNCMMVYVTHSMMGKASRPGTANHRNRAL